jgi:8-hydroxy-5-deazaflavin:NADPH oxidoreductase
MEAEMKIGIIGSGAVGAALSKLFGQAGHEVRLGSRTPNSAKVSYEDACTARDVVIIAIPFSAVETVLPALVETIGGSIVVDATNPLNPDWSPLQLGEQNSAAETISRLLPNARVVKAFNTIFADIMNHAALDRDGRAATAFIAGDDDDAIEVVARLAADVGLAPQKTGALSSARYLEAMAHLNIAIAVGQNGGTNAAFIYHSA